MRTVSEIDLSEYTHKLYCYICHGTIVACESPIPDFIIEKLRNTPCSKCVPPDRWIKILRKEDGK